jgi:hypothetical protein
LSTLTEDAVRFRRDILLLKEVSTFALPNIVDFIVAVDNSTTGISPHRLQARKPLQKYPAGTAQPSVDLPFTLPTSFSTLHAVPPSFSPSVGAYASNLPLFAGCCLC